MPVSVRYLGVRLALILGVAGGAILLFLLPDLFYAIPWEIRKPAGWLAFFGVVALGCRRIVTVRPGDRGPGRAIRPRRGRWESCLPWLLAGLVAALGWPLFGHVDGLGLGDWEYYAAKYEAARRSIVDYGQFPWWDPWTRGGFPLAANPLCGVFSVAMPLVLAFGTTAGLRLAVLVSFWLAAEGARRLALQWLGDPLAAATAGLVYALNGGVLVASVAAYDIPMGYAVLPWMLYHVSRLDRGRSAGLWLGFWGAFNLLNGIAYFTVYVVLIAAAAWLRMASVTRGRERARLAVNSVLALGVALALAGWRLSATGQVARDYPRIHDGWLSHSVGSMAAYLMHRPTPVTLLSVRDSNFWETTWYHGPIVLALAVASLWHGWRWWHALALVCAWLAIGSSRWFEASYWLSHFPLFSSMYVVQRWRHMASLGLALASASVVAIWGQSESRTLRGLARVAPVGIALDYLAYGFSILPLAFSVPPTEDRFPGPPLPVGGFVQVEWSDGFTATARGYGVVRGYEPILGYDRVVPTARLWRGHPEYRGEFWTDRGEVSPTSWSPNRIVLQVEPGATVMVNQNPGSWWLINGERPPEFVGMRCAETTSPFRARGDERGRLELRIRPPHPERGLWLHAAGCALIGLAWLARVDRSTTMRPSATAEGSSGR